MNRSFAARRNLLRGAGAAALAVGGIASSASPAAAQTARDYPWKPIRILVPFGPGSGSDADSRAYGDILSKITKQPVLVENRPGASGMVMIQAVKAAPADGHTIMLASNSPMTVNPVVIKDLPYDPNKDFRPIAGLGRSPVAFIVRGDTPYRTVKDYTDAAKKAGRPIPVGNYSAGYQLVAAWLATATGAQVTHVPYKGAAQMFNDIVGGQLEMAATEFGGAGPLIKEGRLRALAITGDRRHPDFPDIPTMLESGYPEFETYVWSSFYLLANTPDDIANRLVELIREVMATDAAKTYQASRASTPMHLGPAEMRRFQEAELARFRKVAEAAGIQPQ